MPPPSEPEQRSFLDVLARRRSQIGDPISWDRVSELLWHCCRTRGWSGIGRANIPIEHRALPSAGALHSVCVVADMTGTETAGRLRLYLPGRHAFAMLPETRFGAGSARSHHVRQMCGAEVGCTLWLVGDMAKIEAAYIHGESLLWRDAGAIVAGLSLTAEFLGMCGVPLGAVGEAHQEDMGFPKSRFLGLGGIHLSEKPATF